MRKPFPGWYDKVSSKWKQEKEVRTARGIPGGTFFTHTKGICFTSCSSTMIITNLYQAIFVSSQYLRVTVGSLCRKKKRRKCRRKECKKQPALIFISSFFPPSIFLRGRDFPNNIAEAWEILFKGIASVVRPFSLALPLIRASIFGATV